MNADDNDQRARRSQGGIGFRELSDEEFDRRNCGQPIAGTDRPYDEWGPDYTTVAGTPAEQLEQLVLAMLKRDYDPAGVPPYFRVKGVSVRWEGGERRMFVEIAGTTNRYSTK